MNPNNNEKKTPAGLKKFLIALLILTAVSGYALNIVLFSHGAYQTITTLEFPTEKIEPLKEIKIDQISSLLEKTVPIGKPEIVITFQGTLEGEEGVVAIVNDEMIAPGAEIDGVRILEINGRVMTFEYAGQTQLISIGETVKIHR